MSKCYRCEDELTLDNSSVEHVIINACGGKLKSSKLLCAKCNSIFGEQFDKELALATNDLANLLLIKRERGEPQKIRGLTSETKKEYYFGFDGDISMIKPEINLLDMQSENISDRKINVKAPNVRILKQTLQGLKRKYPNLDIEGSLKKAIVTKNLFNETIEIQSFIGGQKVFKSILKTAINFYILNNGRRTEIAHLFPYLENQSDLNVVWMYYPNELIYEPLENEITHIIKIVGNPREKILYCYVELFNIHCFVIQLNIEYSGNEINADYIFNVHTQEVKSGLTKLSLKREQLTKLFSERDANPFENIKKRYERVLIISQRMQYRHHLNRAISQAVNKSFEDKGYGEMVNEELLSKMRNEFFEAIRPFLNFK
jgi:hypothetical protein